MRKERGALATLQIYALLAAGVVLVGMGLTIYLYRSALENCRLEHRAFVAETKAVGEKAQREADAEKARLTKAKENADATAKRLAMELDVVRTRLRSERASRNLVSAAPAGSRSPQVACFNRADLGGALQRFEAGIISLLGEGDNAVSNLNVAKGWIRAVSPTREASETSASQ